MRYLEGSWDWIINSSPYYIHAVCLSYSPWLIFGLTVQHLIIWLCYMIISGCFSRPAVYDRFPAAWLFFWFIHLCGWSHFTALLTIWTPFYWISFVANGLTVIASIPAAYSFYVLSQHWTVLDQRQKMADST